MLQRQESVPPTEGILVRLVSAISNPTILSGISILEIHRYTNKNSNILYILFNEVITLAMSLDEEPSIVYHLFYSVVNAGYSLTFTLRYSSTLLPCAGFLLCFLLEWQSSSLNFGLLEPRQSVGALCTLVFSVLCGVLELVCYILPNCARLFSFRSSPN